MAKRIVICSDGTWNTPDRNNPTNVVKFARAIAPNGRDGKPQIVYYDQGVGTGNFLDRITGGAFGGGLEKNIEDAYRFLMHNYDDGDQIFLFGFSRGAYAVRSAAGMIRNCGILRKTNAHEFPKAYKLYRRKDAHPSSEESLSFRTSFAREVRIEFIGVWDTVGALGIPVRGLRSLRKGRYEFHDVELSKYVKHGYHALAIDEGRGPFKPSLWAAKENPGQTVEQVWFAGVHSDVGGGYASSGLSDEAFMWMKEKAAACGLAFDEESIDRFIRPDAFGRVHNSKVGIYKYTPGFTRPLGSGSGTNQAVHPGTVAKHRSDPARYSPKNFVEYLNDPAHRIAVVKEREWEQSQSDEASA